MLFASKAHNICWDMSRWLKINKEAQSSCCRFWKNENRRRVERSGRETSLPCSRSTQIAPFSPPHRPSLPPCFETFPSLVKTEALTCKSDSLRLVTWPTFAAAWGRNWMPPRPRLQATRSVMKLFSPLEFTHVIQLMCTNLVEPFFSGYSMYFPFKVLYKSLPLPLPLDQVI